jgi:putative ABC transport system permease protein
MDDFHTNKENIYMMVSKQTPESKITLLEPGLFFNFKYQEHPELKNFTGIRKYPKGDLKLNYREKTFSPAGIVVDSAFFEIFDFELKLGNKKDVLLRPDGMVLTERLAKIIFGDEDPLGRKVNVKSQTNLDFEVTGIVENPPSNSSMTFDFILPSNMRSFSRMGGEFILADINFDQAAFEEKIRNIGQEHLQFKESEIFLAPLSDIHFNEKGIETVGIVSKFSDRKNLNILILVMSVLFIISALNFSNLQVINTNFGLKNNAIKRVNGAGKNHLSNQKIVESLLFSIISIVIVSITYQLVLPSFNRITMMELSPSLWEVSALNCSILLLMAGLGSIYPVLTGFKNNLIENLKNQKRIDNHLVGRKITVIFQYALTLTLLISAVVITQQLRLLMNKDLGFDDKNVASVQMMSGLPYFDTSEKEREAYKKKYDLIKNELATNPVITAFSQGDIPMDVYPMGWKRKDGDFKYETQNLLTVTPNYDEVLGLELTEGRFFNADLDASRGHKVVINEAAKKYWNIQNIEQSKLSSAVWDQESGWEIIGVVKNFDYQHLATKPQPLLMLYMENIEDSFLVKFEEGATQSGLLFLEKLYKDLNPTESFDYSFLKDDVAKLYQKEKQLSTNYILFTTIAFLISIIGLFTIALYDTERRVKEIAVRKVNGAMVWEILVLLNKTFLKWVGVALMIAAPIAYFLMENWLQDFAYRINLTWWIFALTGLSTFILALLTVSWHSYRAATTNPVKSLRTE